MKNILISLILIFSPVLAYASTTLSTEDDCGQFVWGRLHVPVPPFVVELQGKYYILPWYKNYYNASIKPKFGYVVIEQFGNVHHVALVVDTLPTGMYVLERHYLEYGPPDLRFIKYSDPHIQLIYDSYNL